MIREKTGSTHAETLNIFWQQPETSDIKSSSQKCHKNQNMLITIRNQKVLPTTRIEIRTFWYQHPRDQTLSQLGKKVNRFWQFDNYRTNIRKWYDQNEHQAECIGIFWQHSENPDNNSKKKHFRQQLHQQSELPDNKTTIDNNTKFSERCNIIYTIVKTIWE